MKLYQQILTKNECYIRKKPMKPQGIMVHSTAANNVKLSRYVGPDDGRLGYNAANNHWNHPHPARIDGWMDKGPHAYVSDGSGYCKVCRGMQICCHAFIGRLKNGEGDVATYQTLPWDVCGWHCGRGPGGKTANDTHIGFEICEDNVVSKTPNPSRAYFELVYREAVELCAFLCEKFNLNPLEKGVIIDHAEGAALKIASGHGDVAHWWTRFFGVTMNDFRAAVAAELKGVAVPPQPVWVPAIGDIVRFQNGRTTYYPGGPAFAASIRTGDPHVITKIDSGGKQVVYGGSRCVLLGERVNLDTGKKSPGVNTWSAVEYLNLEQAAGAAVMEEEVA